MKTSIRTGIVAAAGAVALGTVGFGAAALAADDNVKVKRDDTTVGWVQSTDVDDDPGSDDPQSLRDDSPTLANQTHNTAKTVQTAPTKNTVRTAPSKNTGPTDGTR